MSATDADNEFHIAYPGTLPHLNPYLSVDARSNWATMLHHDTLLNLDTDYRLIPWIAEDWTKSANGMQVNFTLRDDVYFYDDTLVTPADVKHSIDFTKAATGSPTFANTEKVENVTIDGDVIVVNFIEPYAWGEYDIGFNVWNLPSAFWTGKDYDDPSFDLVAATADKVGCGPYEYVKGVTEQSWTFEKFVNYWDTGGPTIPNIAEGNPLPVGDYPLIENVTIYYAGGSGTRLLGMEADQYDTERYESYSIDIMKSIQNGTAYPNLKVAEYPSEWLYKITFNTAVIPLDDVVVRRAIAYAIDRDACVDFTRGGYGYPAYSWVPEVYYADWYNPNIEKYPTNIEKAKQLLEDAGYIDVDGDGIREVPGHYTTTTTPTTTPTTTTTDDGGAPGFGLTTLIVSMLIFIPIIRRKRK